MIRQLAAASRPKRLRLWSAAAALSLFALAATAPSARADQTIGAELVGATPGTSILVVPPGEGTPVSAYAALLQVKLEDGTVANAFCIQRYVPTTLGNKYVTESWSDQTTAFGAAHVGSIRWILDHAPPTQTIAELESAVGVALTPAQAYAAIQAAIWHFSDGISLDPGNAAPIVAAYEYLVTQATANAGYVAPDPSISLTPPPVPGEAGGLVGPFTIAAGPGPLAVDATVAPGAPPGTRITDASGNPIAGPFHDGDRLYLSIPADAPAGSAKIAIGAVVDRRDLYLMPDSPPDSQRLVLASTVAARIDAEAQGMWVARRQGTAAPGPAPAQAQVRVKRARLRIAKAASRNAVRAGGTVRYRISVTNAGDAPAREVRICDRLPGRVTIVSAGGGRLAGGSLCWTVRSLAPSRTVTRSITVRVDRDAGAGTMVNSATVTGDGGLKGSAKASVRVLPGARKAVTDGLVTG